MRQQIFENARRKSVAFNLKTLSAAVASALLLSTAHAAGLGKLTVLSALGQPLHAEIELTSISKEEAGSVAVKLASPEAFRQANIEFNPALFSLRFSIEQRGGQQVVRVTSSQPINEPFVDMLLEVGGSNSRLTREYTFLLDPADLRKPQTAQVASANVASQPAVATSPANRAASAAQPAPIKPAESSPRAQAGQRSTLAAKSLPEPSKQAATVSAEEKSGMQREEYQVKQGDTLAKIASHIQPEGVSLDQMLVALQRANPDAFVGNNINRLRSGQILTVPDATTVRGIGNAEAHSIVVAQAADFNSYRNKLASQVGSSSPQKSEEGRQSAAGKVTAKIEEQPNAANEAKDKLHLSKSGAAAGSNNATAGAEDKIAREKALAEANSRVSELEKNVADLQKLLEIKNKELAERQKQSGESKTAAAATEAAANKPATTANAAKTASAPPATPEQAPATSATADSASSASSAAGVNPAAPSDTKAATAKAEKPVTPVKRKPIVQAPPPEPSLVDNLLDNPLLLGAAGAALAALAGLGIYSRRRRKQLSEFQDSNLLTDSGLKTNSLFGSTGGQSVDTNNSVFNSNFTPSASQLDTNEVDPVAEADVYIAYGRDAQAEEILKEALRIQPERNAVRLKLLEIYASRKDLRAFETIASELYGVTRGQGDDWQQAASLGLSIDPKNPLYAGAKSGEASVVPSKSSAAAVSSAMDDLDLDALLNTTQGANSSLGGIDALDAGKAEPVHEVPKEDFAAFEPAVAADELNKADHLLPEVVPAVAPIEIAEATPVSPANISPSVELKPETGPVADAVTPLDFDFDLPGLGLKEEPPTAPANVDSLPELNTAGNSLDFDFELDKPAAAKFEPSADKKTTDETIPPGESLADLRFPTPDKTDAAPADSQAPAAPAAMDFDLSGITLDLNPEATAQPSSNDDFAVPNGPQSFNVAEMATKLDLALAYQEIGDKEGARELLDEVLAGGSSEQVEKARSMLLKIA